MASSCSSNDDDDDQCLTELAYENERREEDERRPLYLCRGSTEASRGQLSALEKEKVSECDSFGFDFRASVTQDNTTKNFKTVQESTNFDQNVIYQGSRYKVRGL